LTEIKDFFEEFKGEFEELELAYIGAKYLPIKYSKEKTDKLLNFVTMDTLFFLNSIHGFSKDFENMIRIAERGGTCVLKL